MQLRLLGTVEVNLQGKSIAGTLSKKAQAILAYLGMTGRPQSRAVLATLLWGDMPDSAARTNLRKALALLRQELTPYLQIERQSVAFAPEAELWVDAVEFETLINAASSPVNAKQLQTAVNLYNGDFLTGFYVHNAPDFEAWMLSEQARLRELMIKALHTLTTHFAEHGELSQGITAARRLLNLEPWREEAHRQLMLLLAQDGQRGAALAQFEACREMLAEELGVEPGRETVALYKRIRDDELVIDVETPKTEDEVVVLPPQRSTLPASQAPPTTAVLPAQPTSFVGREQELADICQLLLDEPDCRMVSLVGPGGIGKTRLAIQSGHLLRERQTQSGSFSDGILFVSLAPVSTAGGLVSAIAEAANFHFYSSVPPRQQLLDYLQGKEILLILDNFEHLLPEAMLISDILTTAPGIKVLATSIESLNLQEEWVHPVAGLPYPQDEDPTQQMTNYDAVRLFEQSARRARIDFKLANETHAVAQICRLVEGMPLGIELAAAWLKVLPAAKIVREIEKSVDFLATRQQNVTERHRSIRAVCEYSWQLLTLEDQTVFKRLSVFRSSFDQEAAEEIAEASLPTLAVLVEKSLLRVTETARYQLHELLRKFAAAKLAEDSSTASTVRERHSAYYLDFLQARQAMLTGHEQQTAVAEITEESDNVREAWLWAIDQGNLASIAQTLTSFFNFFMISSQFHQGEEIFERLLDHLQGSNTLWERPQYDAVRARALIRRGAFCYFLGDYEQASQYVEEGLQTELAPEQQSDVAFAYLVLGVVAGWQGNRELAEKWLHQSLAMSREIDDQENLADALHELAQLHGSFGNYVEAKRLAQESLTVSRAYGRPDWIAHALMSLGWATVCLGGYVDAEKCIQEALALYKLIGSQHGVAAAEDHLGWIAWCQGEEKLESARSYYEQSLSNARQTGYRLFISNTLGDLALLANEMGEYVQAQEYSREGLQLAEAIGSTIYTSYHLCCLGGAACGLGEYAEGRRHLLEALKVAHDVQLAPTISLVLLNFANLLVKEGEAPRAEQTTRQQSKIRALELLVMIIQDPVTWQGVRDRAKHLQAQLEAKLPDDIVAMAVSQGQNKTTDSVIAELLQPGQI